MLLPLLRRNEMIAVEQCESCVPAKGPKRRCKRLSLSAGTPVVKAPVQDQRSGKNTVRYGQRRPSSEGFGRRAHLGFDDPAYARQEAAISGG